MDFSMMNCVRSLFLGWRFFFGMAVVQRGSPILFIVRQTVVILGFPIWWYVAPTIINTFLEAYDFSGKTLVLFATSGGSGFGKTVEGLKPSAPGATIREGKLLNGKPSVSELKKWVDGLEL